MYKRFYFLLLLCLFHVAAWAQTFYGIGVHIVMDKTMRGGLPLIESIIPGSPAEKAGLQAGWHIYSVDLKPLNGKTQEEVLALIRGTNGSVVKIQVVIDAKGPSNSYKTFKITRAAIKDNAQTPANTPPAPRFADSTRQSFYNKCKAISKRVVEQGFSVSFENVYDNCTNRYIKFNAKAGTSYHVRVYTLGKTGFTADAKLWADDDASHPVTLTQTEHDAEILKFEAVIAIAPIQNMPYTLHFDDGGKSSSECKAFYVMIIE